MIGSDATVVEQRFTFKHEIGAGGFGVVYRAHDAEMGVDVALKILRLATGPAIYRFKREFRSLADLVHPNLINLHELQSRGDTWFFTMDLIEGGSFLDHVRPSGAPPRARSEEGETATAAPPLEWPEEVGPAPRRELSAARRRLREAPLDIDRLRSALRQLVEGVAALHGAGKLHCDIKPSNVLVDRDGHVVLCDFGLVYDVTTDVSSTGDEDTAGTPSYMSPEQAAGQPLGPASDWYSVGVVLYEALTGERPFEGDAAEVIRDKQDREPSPPSAHGGRIPAELESLCTRLLRRDPAERPGVAEIRALLGEQPSPPLEADAGAGPAPFVGRAEHLAALRQALDEAQAGRTVTLFLHGESGIGKTTLVRHFLEEVHASDEAFVVSGRCYERESVPYKALDSIVDALADHLADLDADRLAAILPYDSAALSRLFPVLRRVPLIAEAAIGRAVPPDPQELRRRAFGALRNLLLHLGGARAVIVFIDDMQWGDADSAAFLADLLQRPLPCGLLLLGCHRGEDVAASPLVSVLSRSQVRTLTVSPLDERDAVALVMGVRGEHDARAREQATELVRSAGGHPLYVAELARVAGPGASRGDDALTLEELIDRRLERLSPEEIELVRACAVAAHPVPISVAVGASGQTWDAGLLARLRRDRLIRATGHDAHRIEPYHDRVRAVITAGLTDADRRGWHRRLATAYEETGHLEPPVLVEHWLAAGERSRAGHYAAKAAADAESALSFHLAADYYALALDLCELEADAAREMRARLGHALGNAGRLDDSAMAFQQAAEGAPPEQALELRRQALEQVLRAGHLDEGIVQSRAVLAEVGLTLPRSHGGAILSVLRQRLLLRLRGLDFVERPANQIDPDLLRRIDVGWSVASGLSFVDRVLGAPLQMRHVRDALAAGEPHRVARGLAFHVGVVGGGGTKSYDQARQLYARAKALAERVGDPHALALADACGGLAAFMAGHFKKARELLVAGLEQMLDHCTDVRWEADLAEIFHTACLVYLGEIKELRAVVPGYLRAAEERGDVYAAAGLRGWRSNVIWLATDQPDEARRQAPAQGSRAAGERFHLHHYYELLTHAQIDLYTGDVAAAWDRIEACWRPLERSLLMRIQSIAIEAWFLRGRTALAMAAQRPGDHGLVRIAERAARILSAEDASWASALAELLWATLAARDGDRAAASRRLDGSITGFEGADMGLHAAIARQRLGELTGGAEGDELQAMAEAFMRDQEISNPQAMAAMYSPGW